MILKNIKEQSSDCVIFGLSSISGRAILFHCMLPNGASFIDYLSQRSFKKNLKEKTCLICEWINSTVELL